MKITLAFDSFKGSLTSDEVAEAFQEGLLEIMPHCSVRTVCIADGGEGTAEALVRSLDGRWVECTVSDPIGRPITARYGIVHQGKTAIMEMAEASGLTLLKEEERNPMKASTYGTGQLMAHAIKRGCSKILLGIGGSATNDGGTGMLRALGFRFMDKEDRELEGGGEILDKISRIDDSLAIPELRHTRFVVACDVTNPLYGPNGAAQVFAPQKGATHTVVEILDRGLQNYAQAILRFNGKDVAGIPGAGAAGGCGAGLVGLLDARLERGIDFILDAMHFQDAIQGSNLVVTGEGCIDRQTVMGKAPSGVLRAASALGIPCMAIGGCVRWCRELEEFGFQEILCINEENMSTDEAMQYHIARSNVKRTAEKIARNILSSHYEGM